VYCWKNNTVGVYVKARDTYIPSFAKGVSDILGVLPGGRFLAVEVKRPGGKISPQQLDFISNIRDSGGLAFIAYDVEDVQKQLNENK